MKHMFKEVANHAKENPVEFTISVVFLVFLFSCLYAALWFNTIVNGNTY